MERRKNFGTCGNARCCPIKRIEMGEKMEQQKRIVLVDEERTGMDTIAMLQAFFKSDTLQLLTHEQIKEGIPSKTTILLIAGGPGDQAGREACQYIKRNGVTLPIIFISGYPSEENKQAALDAGASTVTEIPLDLDRLKITIDKLVKKNQA